MSVIFVTGTDTGVGKTYQTCRLLQSYAHDGQTTLGIKPLATGARWQNGRLVNDDALLLKAASSMQRDYHEVNPLVFEPAIAPHLAARQANVTLTVASMVSQVDRMLRLGVDRVLLEGVGGWYVPLNETETMADFVCALQIPVLLIVGMRLGCLSHALLTHDAIAKSGVTMLGWIANCIDPSMPALSDNIITLETRLGPQFAF